MPVLLRVLLISLLLSGCATMRQADEPTFHVLNAIDAYQTTQYRHLDCIEEGQFPTRQILGAEPKPTETYTYFLVVSLGYDYLHREFSDRAWWPWIAWPLVFAKATAVVDGYKAIDEGC